MASIRSSSRLKANKFQFLLTLISSADRLLQITSLELYNQTALNQKYFSQNKNNPIAFGFVSASIKLVDIGLPGWQINFEFSETISNSQIDSCSCPHTISQIHYGNKDGQILFLYQGPGLKPLYLFQ
eukprot:TRINITY_DN16320_c0_g1_i1.p4 TRINITY_DN16320_c0_g1~~TRINITY_DN16320_c0_g1_i1.p4  ORF type:complete len:127 (-),score=5.18 TRINITY_DN16320_c0_g1_i1:288-668(-)